MSNLLNHEKSPYLIQHADNPVDWRSWSDEAFREAKKRNVPVFLSIGYATCHWCHVMAHESFEDDEVATLMNEAFVNVKVDREERPDIDSTYMRVCQMMTGQGGWPLTIIMTPDKQPFFSATYIPRESRGNRMGMIDLIPRISDVWARDRDRVFQSADRISREFSRTLEIKQGNIPGTESLSKALENLQEKYDETHGGFGNAPKFPSPHTLSFLMTYGSISGHPSAVEMASHTLEQMRYGGIFDHVGFGFHRYSTDRRWFLPHFEKMLYDQALLMRAYTDAWKITGNDLFKKTVYEIYNYVISKLTNPAGGFYSAEDADSDGEEGKFYVWTLDEVQSLLNPGDAALVADIYSMDPDGNFRDEATGVRTGQNILSLKKPVSLLARERDMDEESLGKRLDSIRKTLYKQRETRIHPFLDDKILTDWNGLMISSLACAASAFREEMFLQAAKKASGFISETMISDNHQLLHRYRDGEAGIEGMADDYAFFIDGQLSLFHTTFKTEYLDNALGLSNYFMAHFMDDENGGFYLTSRDADALLGRQKEIYDGAIPSSNSVMAHNLVKLSRLTGDTRFEDAAENLFKSFSRSLSAAPEHSARAIEALLFNTETSYEIVICGQSDNADLRKMNDYINQTLFSPHVLIVKNENNAAELARLAPYTASYPITESPQVYICKNFSCKAPVKSLSELKKVVSQLHS